MKTYYNEHDKFCVKWLENLVGSGHISSGRIDGRGVAEVSASDLSGFDRAHFFAGIGGWDLALQLAGWPSDLPVWTGSCPCQPFSQAGKRKSFSDERHLWPVWFELICKCRPPILFGEQVASAAALEWLDVVFTDLEGQGYACAAADLCAACIGAPHIRQRLYWVAHTDEARRGGRRAVRGSRDSSSIFDPRGLGKQPPVGGDVDAGVANADKVRREPIRSVRVSEDRESSCRDDVDGCSEAVWIPCRDGFARPIESGIEPLAHDVPCHMGRLRAYGNAIVPLLAAEFVLAVMEVLEL